MQGQMKKPSNALMLVFVLALAGVIIAGLLSYWHLQGADIPCTNQGCDKVAQSVYSRVMGVPVAIFGLGYYLFCLFAAILLPSLSSKFTEVILPCLVVFSIIGVLISGYLTFLEVTVIHALCQWCIGSAIVSLLLLPASVNLFLHYKPSELNEGETVNS